MVDRWMSPSTISHCFLLVLTGGSGSSSSDATLRRFVAFQLLPAPYTYSANAHLQAEKELPSACRFWDCLSQTSVWVQPLIVPSCMQYGFQVFSSPRATPKNLSAFCLLSLIYSVCLLTFIAPWPDGSAPGQMHLPPVAPAAWALPRTRGGYTSWCPGACSVTHLHLHTVTRQTRGPMTPEVPWTLRQSFWAPLHPLSHLLPNACTILIAAAAEWEVFRHSLSLLLGSPAPPVSKQLKSKEYAPLNEETAEVNLPFLSSTNTNDFFSVAVTETH